MELAVSTIPLPSDHEQRRAGRIAALRAEIGAWLSAAGDPAAMAVNLELCCGHGHFLVDFAAHRPAELCVGVDFCRDRIQRALRKRERSGRSNLHFFRAEAFEFLAAWPATVKINRVFVLFPDPWPKRRHRKNRLVGPRLFSVVQEIIAPGAELFFRTDAVEYFAEVQSALADAAAWDLLPAAPWPFERPTVFQQKAVAFQSLCAVNVAPAR